MRAYIARRHFPDCELSDHTGKHRKLCELQGQHPISRDRYRSIRTDGRFTAAGN
jgi:hypothetical protein